MRQLAPNGTRSRAPLNLIRRRMYWHQLRGAASSARWRAPHSKPDLEGVGVMGSKKSGLEVWALGRGGGGRGVEWGGSMGLGVGVEIEWG